MAKVGRFTVSREMIIQALNMPKDSKIHRVVDAVNYLRGDVEFYVEHDALNNVKEGEMIPKITPMITRHTHVCRCNESVQVFETFDWDWGLEDG